MTRSRSPNATPSRDRLTFLRRAALLWVNRRRRQLGLYEIPDLPPGTPYNCHKCPVALAFPDSTIFPPLWYAPDSTEPLRLPESVCAFARCFDAGLYPDLLASP